MKILLVSQWYLPEPQKLLGELATSLQQVGHEVIVVTGFPNWPNGHLYPGYRIKLWQWDVIDGVRVLRLPLYPNHSASAMKRACNLGSFMISLGLLGPFLLPRPDIVHLLQPITAALPAWMLAAFWRVPMTVEVQDLWPETLAATSLIKNRRVLDWIGGFAMWVYRRSARIRVISNGFRENLIAKGVEPEKIETISNWVDTEHYCPVSRDTIPNPLVCMQGRFNIVFAGVIGRAQALETVLDAAELLRDLPAVQFVIAGDGSSRKRLTDEALRRGLANVRFLGWLPENKMPEIYAQAEVLLVHLSRNPLFEITIPHKVFSYLASQRPILAAVDGDAAEIVTAAGAGLRCASGDPVQMANAVRRFVLMPGGELEQMALRARRAACEQFSKSKLTARVEAMLSAALR